MKKLYLFVFAAVVALSASASVNQIPLQKVGEKNSLVKMPQKGWLSKSDAPKHKSSIKKVDAEIPTVLGDDDIPSDCEVKTYKRYSGCIISSWFGINKSMTDGKFRVAFGKDGKAYIQNPIWNYDSYGTWVEGTYDSATGLISVPTGQCLSWYESEESSYGMLLVWGKTEVYEEVDDETGESGYYLDFEQLSDVEAIQFRVDGDYLYLVDSEGDYDTTFPGDYIATGMMVIYSDDLIASCIEFANRNLPFGTIPPPAVPAVPADPQVDEWYDCGDESGYSKLYFTLPTTDVDGNVLEGECLSYSIFIDNGNGPEIFTFSGVDYTYDLEGEETIAEVPYSLYSGAVDFKNYMCYFYRTNEEGFEPLFTKNIGIQVYYTVDGVRNASNIAWLYPAVNVKVGSAGMATFCSDKALDFSTAPSGMKAYIITGVAENGYTLLTEEVTGVVAPATGLLITAAEGTYILYPAEADSYADLSANKLVGVTQATAAPVGSYLLQNQSKLGFYQVEEGTSVTIPAGRAYLPAGFAASGAKGFVFDDDDATGISNVNDNLNLNIYNLAGQRLQKVQKGINIINGKKILK